MFNCFKSRYQQIDWRLFAFVKFGIWKQIISLERMTHVLKKYVIYENLTIWKFVTLWLFGVLKERLAHMFGIKWQWTYLMGFWCLKIIYVYDWVQELIIWICNACVLSVGFEFLGLVFFFFSFCQLYILNLSCANF